MAKISSTTQDHLDILNIKDNIVLLKNGSACAVLQAYAINFDLLSLPEQDAAIAAYSSLLNSLAFPIQVTIRSKEMDISEYIDRIREYEKAEMNSKIKAQIKAYRHFIQEELVVKERVLDKSFYVTIPYKINDFSDVTPFGWINDMIGISAGNKTKVGNVDKIFTEAKTDLEPKRIFLIKEFARIGIKTKPLDTAELIRLYYEFYNSETAQNQKIRGNVAEYTSALVEPKLV
jgi:hypothetical protein